jgi:hypothetical protein
MAGLIFLYRKNRFEFFMLLFFLAALIYFISSWWNWYYGPSFRQRAFTEFYAFIGFLLAVVFKNAKGTMHRLFLLVATCFVILNLIQSYQYHYNIISSWNMSFEKYKYVFLKTAPEYRNCLGGNNDILPWNANLKKSYNGNFDFEKEHDNCSAGKTIFDSLSYSTVCDYSGNEFNMLITVPVNEKLFSKRGLYAEIHLERLEKDTSACSSAYFVIDFSDSTDVKYHYYAFFINETPSKGNMKWRKYSYMVVLPQVKAFSDRLRFYVWNPERKSFYLDNVGLKLFTVN